MYYIKTDTQIIECADLSTALAKIHDLGEKWLLSPVPFEDNKKDAQELKALLQEQGRSNKWLAKALGMTEPHLSKVLNGKLSLTQELKAKIKEVLKSN